jgi:hypothetical protein
VIAPAPIAKIVKSSALRKSLPAGVESDRNLARNSAGAVDMPSIDRQIFVISKRIREFSDSTGLLYRHGTTPLLLLGVFAASDVHFAVEAYSPEETLTA